MCKKCKNTKVSFSDFLKQEKKFEREKTAEENKTYVCSECGTKFRLTKTKILSKFLLRLIICILIVGVFGLVWVLADMSEMLTMFMGANGISRNMVMWAIWVMLHFLAEYVTLWTDRWLNWKLANSIKWYVE